MTTEVRDLMMWVEKWGAAVERPDIVTRRNDLVQRYVDAVICPPAPERTRFDLVEIDVLEDGPPNRRWT